jgi:type IV pilus assembly protein PilX
MKRQQGVVLLLALSLSLLLGLLAAQGLREALMQQRLMGEQLAGARAFEQAEASLIEGAALLSTRLPERCSACLPPGLPDGEPAPPWQATDSGYVLLQNLGESTRAASMPAGQPVTLVRVTAISRQVQGRRVLEAVHALDDTAVPRRISWRQRLEED